MNQILRCDWLPEPARWSYLGRAGLPAMSPQNIFFRKPYNKSFIDQVCSVKMAGYWPHSSFCEFMDLDSVSAHKHAKKELGQYPAILTSHLGNNPYVPNRIFLVRWGRISGKFDLAMDRGLVVVV